MLNVEQRSCAEYPLFKSFALTRQGNRILVFLWGSIVGWSIQKNSKICSVWL